MGCLNSRCTGTLIFASLEPKINNKKSSAGLPPLVHNQNNNGKPIRTRNGTQSNISPKQQPSVSEMERAIGAGIFRDRDSRGSGEKQTLFDLLSNTPISQPEGPIEKKLRETGEWILDATEGPSRSAGHGILMTVCLKILPVWLLFLLIASGLFKLPFNNPALEDLIM
ncbi:hypothetical protein AQUCO_09100044v1 [Aquilegia coerulea]|uniref:Chlororespiratory reduction 3 n=2 Tax=Aquilegia coerulea TaxID=218851 RepID=A0A2G5C5N1_AQUCA|nr:hypothetical protein AQUCO_09100044v1 [Aquilegia coerulea]